MKNFTICAACAGVFCLPTVAAQSLHNYGNDDVDQIVVTGARTPLEINRIGSASTVISRPEIERRQARYVSDLLRAVPGFSVSQTGVHGSQTQVRVRGSEANHVLVLVDGVRANDPATGDEFRWEYLATGNVERIEIIRGSQSALWGSDAVGAVVNVITRSGVSRQGMDVYAEGGANNSVNFGASGVTQIDSWLFSGGIESFDTQGGNISRIGGENDGSNLTSGSMAAQFSASERLVFNAGLRVIDATSETDPIDFFVTGLPVDGDQETQSDNIVGDVGGSLLTRDGRIRTHMKVRYFESKHRNVIASAEESSSASERVSIALQSDIQLNENRLSLAMEHENTDFEQRGAVGFGDPNQDQSMRVTSAIAEYQHLNGDRLTWILSSRFDKHSDFENVLTGKASMAFQWTDDTAIRASVGTGHKAPTFIDLFGFFPQQFIGNPNLKPETSIAFDIGLDHHFLDGLTLQTSVYVQELKDEINGFVFNPVTFLGTAENRSGTSNRSGVELAAQWQVSAAVTAAATYTYTDSDEEDALGRSVAEVRRPRHSGSISLDYASQSERFGAMLVADYGGTRKDLFFPPFPAPQETVLLDNYWLVDLTTHLQLTPTIAVFARGTNLLDTDYEQVFGFQTLGRTGYLGLRASFGD